MKQHTYLFFILSGATLLSVASSHQVPPTFGKSHFIVGMPIQETALYTAQSVKVQESPYERLLKGDIPQVFFTPHDDVYKALVYLIEQEKKSIYLAAYALTDGKVTTALRNAKKRGVEVVVVVDRSCLQLKGQKIAVLRKADIPVFLYDGEAYEDGALMHNKFIVFGENIGHKALVLTGSANMTVAGCTRNHENVLVLDNKQMYERYKKEFKSLEDKAKHFTRS